MRGSSSNTGASLEKEEQRGEGRKGSASLSVKESGGAAGWNDSASGRGEAVDVTRDHGVNGPAPSPGGMFLKQMVGWLGKVGGSFTCLFIGRGVLELRLWTAP